MVEINASLGSQIGTLIMPAFASMSGSSLTLGQQMNAAAGALLPYPSGLDDSYTVQHAQRMVAHSLARDLKLYVPPYAAHDLVRCTPSDESNAKAYNEDVALPLLRFGMSVYAKNSIEAAFADTHYPLHAAHKLGVFSLDVKAAVKTGIVDQNFLESDVLEKMKMHGELVRKFNDESVSPHANFFGSPQALAVVMGGWFAVNAAYTGADALGSGLAGICISELLLTTYHFLRRPDQVRRAKKDLTAISAMMERLDSIYVPKLPSIDDVAKANDGPEMRVFRLRRMQGADAEFPLYPLRANESIYSIPGFELSTFQFVATQDRESGQRYVRVYTGVDGLPYFDLMKAATLEETESPLAAGAIWVDHAGYKPRIAFKVFEGEGKATNAAFLEAGIELGS